MKWFALFCLPGWWYVNMLIDKHFPPEIKPGWKGEQVLSSISERLLSRVEPSGVTLNSLLVVEGQAKGAVRKGLCICSRRSLLRRKIPYHVRLGRVLFRHSVCEHLSWPSRNTEKSQSGPIALSPTTSMDAITEEVICHQITRKRTGVLQESN